MRKELIILSGFLGSGKTTLLRRLLEANRDRRIAVLLNDFGDVPVDGAILRRAGGEGGVLVEIGGGSVFCACLREPFVKALTGMAERDEDMVIVEASGMSDPATIGRMLTLSGLDAVYAHAATLCLFDPVKSLKLARVLEVIPRQLAAATVAVITKADVASPEELEAARAYIREKEPDLPVLESRNGLVSLAGLPRREARQLFAFGLNTPETRPDSFTLETVRTGLDPLLDALRGAEDVLRVKGCVRAADGMWFVSDTGRDFEVEATPETPVPLTVICMKGTAPNVRRMLQTAGIV